MTQRFPFLNCSPGFWGSIVISVCLGAGIPGCDSREAAQADHVSSQSSQSKNRTADTTQSDSSGQQASSTASTRVQAQTSVDPSLDPAETMSPKQEGGPKVSPLPVQFQGPDAEAKQLQVDPERLLAHGIRTLTGKHLILHTDLPLDDELRSLPDLFTTSTQQFCSYFQVEPEKVAAWRVRACIIQDMEKFEKAGLLPQVLPKFQHGYALGDRLFLKEQPSEYYRRHLLIHESTHAFMLRFFQGAGPPWYMEGMAELLGTHQWDGEQLTLRHFPATKEEVPFWGRVKIIKDDVAAQKGKMIEEVMQYGSNAHLDVAAYGWSWAAATFLDQHPDFQKTFRKQIAHAGDSSPQFSVSLVEAYGDQWFQVRQQWQLFVMNMEYGYDIAREAIDAVPIQTYADLPPQQTIQVKANRGWQSTGLFVTQGAKLQLEASGRFVVYQSDATADQPAEQWEAEADGITIRYYRGQPLGKLLIAIDNLNQTGLTGLVSYGAIGAGGEIEIPYDGVLYLRVNDSPAELSDNQGELEVKMSLMEQD